MTEVFHLSGDERKILEVLWESGPIKQTELLARINENGNHWIRQALNTILLRMESRNLVGRQNHIVYAAVNKAEMAGYIASEMVKEYCNGDFQLFLEAYQSFQEKTDHTGDLEKALEKEMASGRET